MWGWVGGGGAVGWGASELEAGGGVGRGGGGWRMAEEDEGSVGGWGVGREVGDGGIG